MNARPIALGVALATLGSAAPALSAPVELSVETNVRLGYDLNPFLSPGSDLSSGYFETSIAPKLSKRSERGEVTLSGHYERTEYFEQYGDSDQYGAELQVKQRINPKLTVFGTLRYDSEVIGQGRNEQVTGPPIDETDINLIGLRRRAETYEASGGWEYQLSPTDTISADGIYSETRYGSGPPGADSRNLGGRVAWKHAIDERSKIGLSASAYHIDYDMPGLSTLIVEPAVTFSTELSPTWHVDASVGISFSKLWLPLPMADDRTQGLSGNLSLCHKGPIDNFCLYADRAVTGSGAGGTVERSQIGINYHRRLTEALSWSGTASYARSKAQAGTLGTREFVTARGGLDWRATRWLTLGAEGRYRDVFGSGRQIRSDLGGELNATITFPERQ